MVGKAVKIIVGVNDLATTHPDLLPYWSKNNTCKLTEVSRSTCKKTLWICPEGHEYQVATNRRVKVGHCCPYCNGTRVHPEWNSFQALHPELVKWWDYDKSELLPTEVTSSSTRTIWAKCPEGHSWETNPAALKRGRGCPYCAGRKTLIGYNDLATLFPAVAREWNDSRKLPNEVTYGSDFRALWKCPKGHEYEATVEKRTRKNGPTGCPVCSGKKVVAGVNDLLSRFPDIAVEFSVRNSMKANEIMYGSHKKVWWKCSLGHEWETTVKSRTGRSKHCCPYCANYFILPGYNDLLTLNPSLANEWSFKNRLLPSQVGIGTKSKAWWRCEKQGHEWEALIDNRNRGSGCPKCAKHISKAETEVADFIKSILPSVEVSTSDRSVITPKELDIFIPDKKIAVEFHGLYWHSETNGKGRNYHYDKWLACRDADIQLIQIWEDEWRDKRSIVEGLLKSKLGVDDRERVYARNTVVDTVTVDEARDFLDAYHLQGFVGGSYYLGLREKVISSDGSSGKVVGDLVAVMVLRKSGGDLYLDRFATCKHVIGGQSKLLKWVDVNVVFERLVTFADLQVSSGGLYEASGWVLDGLLKPDYRYIVDGDRAHKFNYRLKRFESDSELLFQPGLTESQLAVLNGLERVWDTGKFRYVRLND